MNEPIWKLYRTVGQTEANAVYRVWPDGKQESCLVTTPEYLAWLALGNTPLPADEVTQ
jgi:hypothetical protein